MISPWKVTTAPIGTSPWVAARAASRRANRMKYSSRGKWCSLTVLGCPGSYGGYQTLPSLTSARGAADTGDRPHRRRSAGGRSFLRRGFSRADWVGDGIVTVALGGVVMAAVFLPWANVSTGHDVNLSPRATPGINSALATPWGLPVLALAAIVVVVGLAMIAGRPIRLSVLPCVAVSLAGLGVTLVVLLGGWEHLGAPAARPWTLSGHDRRHPAHADRPRRGHGRLHPHLAGAHGAPARKGRRPPRRRSPGRAHAVERPSAGRKTNDEVTAFAVRRSLHVSRSGARETAREGEPQAGSRKGAFAVVGAAARARFEDALALVCPHARSVVVDREHHVASGTLDTQGHVGLGALAGVLDDGLQDAQRHLGVDADEHGRRGSARRQVDAALAGKLTAGRGHFVEHRLRVGAAARQPGLLALRGHERVDGARHGLGVAQHRLQRLPVGVRLALAAQRQLGLGADVGQRGAQLVRQLGRESLLATQAGGETVEQAVERGRELAELVVRLARGEATIRVVRAPGLGVGRHLGDRPQGGGQHPARHDGDHDEQGAGEGQRAEQGDPSRVLIGRHRDADDDGGHPLTPDDGRRGVEAGPLARHVDDAPRGRADFSGHPIESATHRGRVGLAAADERPRLAFEAPLVGHFARQDVAVGHVQGAYFDRRARAGQGVGLVRELASEGEVEADRHEHQGRGHGDHHGQQQARPDAAGTTTERAHGLIRGGIPRRARWRSPGLRAGPTACGAGARCRCRGCSRGRWRHGARRPRRGRDGAPPRRAPRPAAQADGTRSA